LPGSQSIKLINYLMVKVMAITWTANITNVNVADKRADVSFNRLDDVTQETESYNFKQTSLETTTERVALLDAVWQSHISVVSEQTAIDAFITNLEQLGKDNLEAREV